MRKFALALAFAVAALCVAPALAGPGRYNKKVAVGDKAPSFSGVPAIMKGEEASLTLSDIKEDVVVLAFSANHCPVVQEYEDRMIEFVNAYKGKSVKFVAVCVSSGIEGDKLPGIKDYAKEHGSNYVYGFDESQDMGRAYGATNTPQFFVLDKTRTIRYMGALDDSKKETAVKKTYLKDAVDAVLAGKDVEVSETRPAGCGINIKKK